MTKRDMYLGIFEKVRTSCEEYVKEDGPKAVCEVRERVREIGKAIAVKDAEDSQLPIQPYDTKITINVRRLKDQIFYIGLDVGVGALWIRIKLDFGEHKATCKYIRNKIM